MQLSRTERMEIEELVSLAEDATLGTGNQFAKSVCRQWRDTEQLSVAQVERLRDILEENNITARRPKSSFSSRRYEGFGR